MKSIRRKLRWAIAYALLLMPLVALAADADEAEASSKKPTMNFAEWFGLAKGLEVEPKIIAATDGSGSTFGIEYKYHREVKRAILSGSTDVSFSLHSEGLIGVDPKVGYNHLLTHGLRLSILDLFPRKEIEDKEMVAEHKVLAGKINRNYFVPWQKLAEKENKSEDDTQRMDELFKGARNALEPYGELAVSKNGQQWLMQDERGQTKGFLNALYDRVVKRRVVFLTADLNADAETDDRFKDLQLVGNAGLRAKFDLPFLDFPFEMLRSGGGPPKSFLNRKGGPYLWGGVALVDASNNDSRKALVVNDETFVRLNFGLFYRTEIFSLDAEKSVALELTWRYYYELDAPVAIRQSRLEKTSYFRATVLFPKNLFIEYTNGKLPIDVAGAQTVMGGWRYNF
jgi:hypothetical protein